MKIRYATLDDCGSATGVVVVIDVIRAFTTAAYAFASNARDIVLVESVDQALSLRARFPGSLVMGEVGGFPPPGFDLGNSPSALIGRDLSDRRLLQRTGAGTQGAVRCAAASFLCASSFVCAAATVRVVRRLSPAEVTLVCTGDEGEDLACADHLAALLGGQTPAPGLLDRARDAGLQRLTAEVVATITAEQHAEFLADIDCCTELDRFDFALRIRRSQDLLVMDAIDG